MPLPAARDVNFSNTLGMDDGIVRLISDYQFNEITGTPQVAGNGVIANYDILQRLKKETESEIRMTVRQDKTLEGKSKYPISIPGVGLLTAVTVVAETDGFADITNVKQLAGFSGPDVKTVESGTWKGRSKISKKGNSHIRKALLMPAFSKIKKDHATNEYYNRLKQTKGKGMIAAGELSGENCRG